MPRGGARDMSQRREFHNHGAAVDYTMSRPEIAKLLGITPQGVEVVERHAIRKLWRMTLPSCASSRFRLRRLKTKAGE